MEEQLGEKARKFGQVLGSLGHGRRRGLHIVMFVLELLAYLQSISTPLYILSRRYKSAPTTADEHTLRVFVFFFFFYHKVFGEMQRYISTNRSSSSKNFPVWISLIVGQHFCLYIYREMA